MVNNRNNQIEQFISIGRYSQALELFKSIEKTRILSDDEILLKKYAQIYICLDKGKFQKGRDLADEMRKESKTKNKPLYEIDALLGKIENSICIGLFDESFSLIHIGEILLRNIKNQPSEIIKKKDAYFKFLKGRIYAEKYEMINAIEYFQQSYEIRKEINDKFGLIFSLLNLGVSTGSMGNLKKNREYSEQSLSISKELNIEMGIIWNLINLGGIEYHLRNLDDAINYAERCLKICEPKDYKHSCTLCYDIIGHSLFQKGKLNRALQFFKKSLDYRLITGFKNLIAQSYYNIGNIYNRKGELQHGLAYYNKILKIPEVQEDQRSKPAYLTSIGKIYGELGDFITSKRYLLEALDLLKNIKVHIFYFLNFKVCLAKIYHYLIDLSISNNELENIDLYLNELHDTSKKYPDLKQIEQLYRLNKAIILKSSDRLMDKMSAGTIFNGIAEEEIIDHEITIEAMMNLCEVLINELELSGDKRILQEIEELSDRLLEIAQSQYLYEVLAETYFFKAKISLLHLDINNTRSLLTKAQNTANKYGLWHLANKISNEHDSLL
ncbi:MAG: tetratricopeptide repeat protein, partial [Candidatus Lokiarchaeota archaeon]|nr:tetratricopeptide repeat protein [Candidatus Lokiarchaeota archaeon]